MCLKGLGGLTGPQGKSGKRGKMSQPEKDEHAGFTPASIDHIVSDTHMIAMKHLGNDYSISVDDPMLASLSELCSTKAVDIVLDKTDDFTYFGLVDINISKAHDSMEKVTGFASEFLGNLMENLGFSGITNNHFQDNMKMYLTEIAESVSSAIDPETNNDMGILRINYSFNPRLVDISINSPNAPVRLGAHNGKMRLSFEDMNSSIIAPERWLSSLTLNHASEDAYVVGNYEIASKMLSNLATALHSSQIFEMQEDYDSAVNFLMEFVKSYYGPQQYRFRFGESDTYFNQMMECIFTIASCYDSLKSLNDTVSLKILNQELTDKNVGYDDGKIKADHQRIRDEMDNAIGSLMEARRYFMESMGIPESAMGSLTVRIHQIGQYDAGAKAEQNL